MRSAFLLVSACLAAAAPLPAEPPERVVEARSLLGEELERPQLDGAFRQRQEELLAAALADHRADPARLEPLIWVGRRRGYLGRYREAVQAFTRAAELHPESPEPLRHRGHRFITLRRLDDAVADLERAAELIEGGADRVEPDGLPNARNQPTSTLHTNIWYHLGLARYLKGDFEAALAAWERCLEASRNPDMLAATVHWHYMTLRRLGRDDAAAALAGRVGPGMDIIENEDYYRLVLMYSSGEGAEELLAEARKRGGVAAATVGYGIGNWHLAAGRRERAFEIFREIVSGESWAAFGFLAAEAELARERSRP